MSSYLSNSETNVFLAAAQSMQYRGFDQMPLTTPVYVEGDVLHPIVGSLNLQCFDKSEFMYRFKELSQRRYRLGITPTEPGTEIGEPMYSPDEHLPDVREVYSYRGVGYTALCFEVALSPVHSTEITASGVTQDGTEVLLPNTQSNAHSLLYVAMSQLYYRIRQR